jgi:hypothetical protein
MNKKTFYISFAAICTLFTMPASAEEWHHHEEHMRYEGERRHELEMAIERERADIHRIEEEMRRLEYERNEHIRALERLEHEPVVSSPQLNVIIR